MNEGVQRSKSGYERDQRERNKYIRSIISFVCDPRNRCATSNN